MSYAKKAQKIIDNYSLRGDGDEATRNTMNSELSALRDLQEAERAEMAQQAAEQLTNSIEELQSLGQDPVPIIAEQIPELNPYAQQGQGQGQEAPQGQEQGLPQIPQQQQPSQEEMAMMQQQQMQQQQPMAGYGGPRKDHIGGYGYGGNIPAKDHIGGYAMGGNIPRKDHIGGYGMGGRIPAKDHIGNYAYGGKLPGGTNPFNPNSEIGAGLIDEEELNKRYNAEYFPVSTMIGNYAYGGKKRDAKIKDKITGLENQGYTSGDLSLDTHNRKLQRLQNKYDFRTGTNTVPPAGPGNSAFDLSTVGDYDLNYDRGGWGIAGSLLSSNEYVAGDDANADKWLKGYSAWHNYKYPGQPVEYLNQGNGKLDEFELDTGIQIGSVPPGGTNPPPGNNPPGNPFEGIKDKFNKWRYGEAPTQETGESDEDFQARLKKYNEETAAKKAGDKRKVGAAVQSIPDAYGLAKSIQKPDEFNPYLRPDAETTDISSLIAPIADAEAGARGELRSFTRGSGFRNPGAFIAGNSQLAANAGLSEAQLKFQADNADRTRQNEIDLFNISEKQRAKMLNLEQDDNRTQNIVQHGQNIADNITGVGLDKKKDNTQNSTIDMLNQMYPNASVTIGPDGKLLFNGNPLDYT